MRIIIFIQLLLSILLTSVSNLAFATSGGVVGTGGGDIYSAKIKSVQDDLSPSQYLSMDLRLKYLAPEINKVEKTIEISKVGKHLLHFIWFVSKYDVNTPLTNQIKYLNNSGIFKDIIAAKYVIRPTCIDSDGIERAATTQKVNLNLEKPDFETPEICLNVRMLYQISNTAELAALILHEHARHYGLEDTILDTGIHPLSEFYVNNIDQILKYYPGRSVSFFNNFILIDTSTFLKTPTSTRLNLTIEKLDGDCKYLTGQFKKLESSRSLHLVVGQSITFDLQESFSIDFKYIEKPTFFSPYKCELTYRITDESDISEAYKVRFSSDYYSRHSHKLQNNDLYDYRLNHY
jgi:hypothetical protein